MASKSILQSERECWVCGTTQNLHHHHVIYNTANRKLSEKYGLWVYLCGRHHNLSNEGVHFNRDLDLRLKQFAQKVFEAKIGTRDDFRAIFGKSYIL